MSKENNSLEKSILGTIIINPHLFLDASEIITSESFTGSSNRGVFSSIQTLFENGEDVTTHTIEDEYLRSTGKKINIFEYIDLATGGSGFEKGCVSLKQKHLARMQSELAVKIAAMANDPKQDPLDTNDFLMSESEKIASVTTISKPKTNSDLITAITNKMDSASRNNGVTGIRTHFKELDRIYGGRQNSNLIIKAGRPAMGKTSQALCEAKNMAHMSGKHVLFFSLEMSSEELMQKIISIHTEIPLTSISRGTLTQDQWNHYYETTDDLRSDNLTIIDDVYSLSGIHTVSKKMKMRGLLDAIYIDYIQLIEHKVGGRNRENEISEISRGLKMLAKKLDVPVVALSQLSRAVETRGGVKKPMLSDLRESGAIEQDADVVEFIYRPEYYGINETDDNRSTENVAYLIIAKNRHGECRDVEMYFNKKCTKFTDPIEEVFYQQPRTRSHTNNGYGIEQDF